MRRRADGNCRWLDLPQLWSGRVWRGLLVSTMKNMTNNNTEVAPLHIECGKNDLGKIPVKDIGRKEQVKDTPKNVRSAEQCRAPLLGYAAFVAGYSISVSVITRDYIILQLKSLLEDTSKLNLSCEPLYQSKL